MKATRPYLIIVPVGLSTDHFVKLHSIDFPMEKHWRKAENRKYDILAVQYGDYIPEEGTYDDLVYATGNKWKIIKALSKTIDFSQWEYIGAYDDDVITSGDAVNAAFEFANSQGIGAYQQALAPGSESNWPVTQYNEEWSWSVTNFMEIMCPVFSKDNFATLLKLLDKYDVNHGWGLDFIFSDMFKSTIGIFHFALMYHPSRPNTGSSYTKDEAFKEMDLLLTQIYPSVNPSWRQEQGRILSYVNKA